MTVRRLECDREETAAAQGVQTRITDRESGPKQESENFDGQVKKAQCEVGVR